MAAMKRVDASFMVGPQYALGLMRLQETSFRWNFGPDWITKRTMLRGIAFVCFPCQRPPSSW
jgi:hypothetical protein